MAFGKGWVMAMPTLDDSVVTGKNTTFDVPPPAEGLGTVTNPVCACDTSETLIVARN